MEQIICREGDLHLDISDYVISHRPVSLALEPYVGETEVAIELPQVEGLRLLCCSVPGSAPGYPALTYVSEWSQVPEGTYLFYGQMSGGYLAGVSLSHHDQLSRLSGGKDLLLKAHSGTSRRANRVRPAFLMCSGTELYDVMSEVMSEMRRQCGGHADGLPPRSPSWLQGVGWSSSLTMDREPSHDGILDAVWSLKQQGVVPAYVFIGEGWQRLSLAPRDEASMLSFDADLVRFPRGLKGVVDDLKGAGVERVGVWHGLMGYRGGIHAQLAKDYDLPPDRRGRYFPGYDLGKTFEFFYDFYSHLYQQGISFVMVGDQGAPHQFCRPGMDVTELYKHLQTAITAAAGILFDGMVLTSEGLYPECLVHWSSTRFAQTSEDLDIGNPLGPMRMVRNSLSNGMWLQQLMQPLIDGWCSRGPASETLALFHALSGSPTVLGDRPKEHDTSLLQRLMLPDGTVPRPDRPLRPCSDYLFDDPIEADTPLCANTVRKGNGIIALFNLASGRKGLSGTVCARKVPELDDGNYALFSYRRGFIGVVAADDKVEYKLKGGQSDAYTFAPVDKGIALVGSHNYFLTPGAIRSWSIEEELVVIRCSVSVPLLVYCERAVFEVRRNSEPISWEFDDRRHLLTIGGKQAPSAEPAVYTIALE